MGDLLPSIPRSTFASEVDGGNYSFEGVGVTEYGSDAELAEVALFRDYPEPLLRFASVCCVIFMLVGIPGNLITIVALARCKKVSISITFKKYSASSPFNKRYPYLFCYGSSE